MGDRKGPSRRYPLVITPTKLATYERCPMQYNLRYVERAETDDGDSPSLLRANAIHAVLGAAFHSFSVRRSFPIDIEERVASALDRGPYPDDASWSEDVARSVKAVKSGLRWFDGNANVLDIERELNHFVPQSTDHPAFNLRAKVDLLLERATGEVEIVDFKTGRGTSIDVIQNTIYRIVVAKALRTTKVRNTVVHLESGVVYSEIIGREALVEAAEEIKRRIRLIDAETEWAPQLNPLCDFCPFAHRCPIFAGDGADPNDWLDVA
jgi:putative RecB family exonuclease